jgi:hypothetical protein
MQVYQLAIDTILFYDIQVNKIILLLLTYLLIVQIVVLVLKLGPLKGF